MYRSDLWHDDGGSIARRNCVEAIAGHGGRVAVGGTGEGGAAVAGDGGGAVGAGEGEAVVAGDRGGVRHFVHNGVTNEFRLPDSEVKHGEPSRAASVEGGGVSAQRFDQAGDLRGEFRYRDIIRSLDVAS